MKKALIAMSGGVDSSVAALLTKNAGYECAGCTMKLYENEDAGIKKSNTCCSLDDVEDAKSVAYKLKMPYYVFNFTEDFREKVIGKFIACSGFPECRYTESIGVEVGVEGKKLVKKIPATPTNGERRRTPASTATAI